MTAVIIDMRLYKLYKLLILLIIIILSAIPSMAQSGQTTVTATVSDSNGTIYINSPYTVTFYDPGTSGKLPLLNGSTFQRSYSGLATNSSGVLSISLPDNNVIASTSGATGTQWTFSICTAATTYTTIFCIPPTTITITGATQNISAAITAVAPILPITLGNPYTANGNYVGNNTHSGTETFSGPLLQKSSPIFDIRAAPYNGACDNLTDNTTPFHLALIDAQAAGGGIILFPLGRCLFNSKPDYIGNGVKLQGQGWSTNTAVGTSLLRNYIDASTNGFITFDGSFGTAQGTGSGIDDMTIGPAVGTTGGYLVKLTTKSGCTIGADCDNHRASDTHLTNVFLGNGNGGTSACGLYIDGSQAVTPGTQSIRIVNINNFRVSSTTTADCSIYANNVSHLFGNNVEIDAGFGANPGVTITGVGIAPNSAASANVYFSNMELVGDLIVDSASGVQTSGSTFIGGTTSMSANTANSILMGRFPTLPVNLSPTSTWAVSNGSNPLVTPALCVTSTGVCTGANGEIFSVTATTTGVLGMGSDHTVTFNRFNSNSIGFTGAKFCATTVCSSGMNTGDIQAASSATGGTFWCGTDNLCFITRNAGGDVNVKQNLGFRSGTAFLGLFSSPLTTARSWTIPDANGTMLISGNGDGTHVTANQSLRVTGCATAAVLNATCDNTITWTTPFANANYTASCVGDVVTSGIPIIQGIAISAAKTGTAITVRTMAITAAAAQFTTIDCTAIHD